MTGLVGMNICGFRLWGICTSYVIQQNNKQYRIQWTEGLIHYLFLLITFANY